jgi:hypothetical protein
LKGPALAAYYPRKMATIKDLQKAYAPMGLETINEDEEDRFEHIKMYDYLTMFGFCTIANSFAVLRQEGKVRQRRRGQQEVCGLGRLVLDGC